MLVAKFLMILLSVNSSYAANIFSGAIKAADDVPVGAGVKGVAHGAGSVASKAQAEALQAGKQPYAGITGGYKPATGNEVAGVKPVANNGASGSKVPTSDGANGITSAVKTESMQIDMKIVTNEFVTPTLDEVAVHQVLEWLSTYAAKGPDGLRFATNMGITYAKKAALKFPAKCPNPNACNPFHGIQMSDNQRKMGYRIIEDTRFKEGIQKAAAGNKAGVAHPNAGKAQPEAVNMAIVNKEVASPTLEHGAVRQVMQWLSNKASKGADGLRTAKKTGAEYAKKAVLKNPNVCPNPNACNPFNGIQMSDAQRKMGYAIINEDKFKEAVKNPKKVGGDVRQMQMFGNVEGLLNTYKIEEQLLDCKNYLALSKKGLTTKEEALAIAKRFEQLAEAKQLMKKFTDRTGSPADYRRAMELQPIIKDPLVRRTIQTTFNEMWYSVAYHVKTLQSRAKRSRNTAKLKEYAKNEQFMATTKKTIDDLFKEGYPSEWIKAKKLPGDDGKWSNARDLVEKVAQMNKKLQSEIQSTKY